MFFHRLFCTPKNDQGLPKPPQRGPKGYPLATIFGHYGGAGGNLEIVVSCERNHRFHGLRASPGTSCAAPCAQGFAMWFWQPFLLRFVTDLDFERNPGGGPTKDPRTNFFVTFSTRLPWGVPWGAPGRQMTPKGTKMTPK